MCVKASHCNTLQHTLQHTYTHRCFSSTLLPRCSSCVSLQHTLQRTATHTATHTRMRQQPVLCRQVVIYVCHCNLLQHTLQHKLQHTHSQSVSCNSALLLGRNPCVSLQIAATHCNTHCNTPTRAASLHKDVQVSFHGYIFYENGYLHTYPTGCMKMDLYVHIYLFMDTCCMNIDVYVYMCLLMDRFHVHIHIFSCTYTSIFMDTQVSFHAYMDLVFS